MKDTVIRIKGKLGSMFTGFSDSGKPHFTTFPEKAKIYTDPEKIEPDIEIIEAESGIKCEPDFFEHAKEQFSEN